MSDSQGRDNSRFLIWMVAVSGISTTLILGLLNWLQPSKIDVQMINILSIPAVLAINQLIAMLNSNKNREAVKHKVDEAPAAAKDAAETLNTASEKAKEAATELKTASSFAPPKHS